MATGLTNCNSSKKLHTQKPQNNSQNTSRVPHQVLRPQKGFDGVDSEGDSSSQSQSQSQVPHNGTENSVIPGYVKLDDKVRISLNSGSKSVIRELKRKLVSELDLVRSLKKKLDAKETQFNGVSSSNNRSGTLARVNSEVSYVGPSTSSRQPVKAKANHNNNNNNNNNRHCKNLDKEKKISSSSSAKVNRHKKENVLKLKNNDNSNNKKKSNLGTGGKRNVMGRCNVEVFKKCEDLLEKLMKHQYGWVFNKPVDVKKLDLPDYFRVIKHPMDLGTAKSRLKKNWYKTPKEFAEDVRLTFNNAMKYNDKGQDAHIMAEVLLKLFEEKWAGIEAEFNRVERFDMGCNASFPAPDSKRASAPPTSPLKKMTSKNRTLGRSESMTNLMDGSLKAANDSTHEGRTPVAKRPQEMNSQRREMTFEEKQRLSADLHTLPPQELDAVVQIIRKRNPELCQQDDEIEVDIDSIDSETLWELDRLVTNYKKDFSKDKRIAEPVLQAKGEAGHNIEETNLTSYAAEAREESEAVDKFIVTSPFQREKQGDNVSRSSSSSSSSSDSGSSTSDSNSKNSSGSESDAGQ